LEPSAQQNAYKSGKIVLSKIPTRCWSRPLYLKMNKKNEYLPFNITYQWDDWELLVLSVSSLSDLDPSSL
jgi:hypothetical protein